MEQSTLKNIKTNTMSNLTELKALAYDLIATIQQKEQELREVNGKIALAFKEEQQKDMIEEIENVEIEE